MRYSAGSESGPKCRSQSTLTMLRHGCGYALANAGHDTRALQAWLGHKNIQHTVRYTELAPDSSRTSGDRRFVAIGVTSAAGAAAPRTRPFRTIQVHPKDLRASAASWVCAKLAQRFPGSRPCSS
jgi:hypothetical protein